MCSPRNSSSRAGTPRLGAALDRVQAWAMQNLRKLQKLQTGLAEVACHTDLPVTDTHQNIPFAAKFFSPMLGATAT